MSEFVCVCVLIGTLFPVSAKIHAQCGAYYQFSKVEVLIHFFCE